MEKHYDYSVGLNTPYWIQELRTPKGQLILRFDTPQNLSFFVVAILILVIKIIINNNTPIFSILRQITLGASFILWVFLPLKGAKMYCEYEPDGKKMHQYLADVLVYSVEFVLNKKKIYNGLRVDDDESEMLVFEKTNF